MGTDRPNRKLTVWDCLRLALLIVLISCINLTNSRTPNNSVTAVLRRATAAWNSTENGRVKDPNHYIVYLGHHKHRDQDLLVNQHLELLTLVKGSIEQATTSILYHYKHSFSGFAAVLTVDEANRLSRMEEVVSVFPGKPLELQTTRSWEFVGLFSSIGNITNVDYKSDLWDQAKQGKDVIIGVIDTGIWPESQSFRDDGMDELPPNIWRGECEDDGQDGQSRCNRKIIGMQTFRKALEEEYGRVNEGINYLSARDRQGHGTHMAGIAAGRMVGKVSGFGPGGVARGTATGGFPLARIAVYKACWAAYDSTRTIGKDKLVVTTCYEEDILAAIDKAIGDGVHVISVSLGSHLNTHPYYEDSISLGGFHAMQAGVLLAAAAGNYGPRPSTVSSPAPWTITVASTSMDRSFLAHLHLGTREVVHGESLTAFDYIQYKHYPLILGRDALRDDLPPSTHDSARQRECQLDDTLDPFKVKDAIVVCARVRNTDPYTQSLQVQRAGGIAMISGRMSNTIRNVKIYALPTMTVTMNAITKIEKEIASQPSPNASFLPLRTIFPVAPRVSIFSSQGPNVLENSILKPDISAPGDKILSAWPGSIGPSGIHGDKRKTRYNILSGTSMACPHVAALAALLKSIHPSWSPSAIKSAIMTTASLVDDTAEPIKGYAVDASGTVNLVEANPFMVGAGQIDPKKAVDPGLVFDATPDDYIEFLCNIGYSVHIIRKMTKSNLTNCPQTFGEPSGLNQPYVVVDLSIVHALNISRKVTNVGTSVSTYHAIVTLPKSRSVAIEIEPRVLRFTEVGQTLTFQVNVALTQQSHDEFHFGTLDWIDGNDHTVTMPIIVIS